MVRLFTCWTLELMEFDPTVDTKDAWKPDPQTIQAFLEKHFNRSLPEEERSAIMKAFPKSQCGVMSAPKLDEEVKEQEQGSTLWIRQILVQATGAGVGRGGAAHVPIV